MVAAGYSTIVEAQQLNEKTLRLARGTQSMKDETICHEVLYGVDGYQVLDPLLHSDSSHAQLFREGNQEINELSGIHKILGLLNISVSGVCGDEKDSAVET